MEGEDRGGYPDACPDPSEVHYPLFLVVKVLVPTLRDCLLLKWQSMEVLGRGVSIYKCFLATNPRWENSVVPPPPPHFENE